MSFAFSRFAFITSLTATIGCLHAQVERFELFDTICCVNTWGIDSIDINQDGIQDVNIGGEILTDVGHYYAESRNSSFLISSPVECGSKFESWDDRVTIALGAVGCLWTDYQTGEPNRYIAVLEINGNDTLWSYIEIEFSEEDPSDASCWDSRVIAIQLVRSTIPNKELFAGEGLETSLLTISPDPIIITPNPATRIITLVGTPSEAPYIIFNSKGDIVQEGFGQKIEITALCAGVYVIICIDPKKYFAGKFIKI